MNEAARKVIPISDSETLGQSLLQRIGNTPLLRFQRITRDAEGVQVLAKAEWANPGGSVKDRAAANIVAEAIRTGKLVAGKTLLDSTSGNTGIAYAMLGAARLPGHLCLPANVSSERKRMLHAYGAEMIFHRPGRGLRRRHTKSPRTRRGRAGQIFLRRPVFQRRQLARPLLHHGERNLAPDRGPHHPFRGHARHQRHIHRHSREG